MPVTKYIQMETPCDCSQASVTWAIERYYTEKTETPTIRSKTVPLVINLHVHPMDFAYARRVVAQKMNGELPPQLNVLIDHELERNEWYVSAPDIKGAPSYGSLVR